MAQLSDDCFAFGGPLLSVEEAVRLIAERVQAVEGVEEVALQDADGRVLAENLVASIGLPPFDNSAVDGYAVRFADLAPAGPTVLRVDGRLAAGAPTGGPLLPGTARRIFTGAALPAAADTVFMQEDVRSDEAGGVVLPSGLKGGANTRSRGEDLRQGTLALPAGRRLRPQDLALAAALGQSRLCVRRRVRVGLFSTGDEIAEPGEPLREAQLYDANRTLIAALARRAGALVSDLGIVRDDAEETTRALDRAARDHDLILTSGGVSTGDEDHVKAAVERSGRLVFWRLGIKPGRPVAMGVVAGVPLIGLPGNPVAAFVTFAYVARPLIAALSGASHEPAPAFPVRAAFTYKKKEGRREFVRVRLARGPDGVLEAHKHPQDGAGILTSLTETDGLAELREPLTAVAAGDVVGFLPYTALL